MEEKRKKKEKIEKQIATSGPPPEGGLRVSIKINLSFNLPGIFKTLNSSLFRNFKWIIRKFELIKKHE